MLLLQDFLFEDLGVGSEIGILIVAGVGNVSWVGDFGVGLLLEERPDSGAWVFRPFVEAVDLALVLAWPTDDDVEEVEGDCAMCVRDEGRKKLSCPFVEQGIFCVVSHIDDASLDALSITACGLRGYAGTDREYRRAVLAADDLNFIGAAELGVWGVVDARESGNGVGVNDLRFRLGWSRGER